MLPILESAKYGWWADFEFWQTTAYRLIYSASYLAFQILKTFVHKYEFTGGILFLNILGNNLSKQSEYPLQSQHLVSAVTR